MTPWLKVTLIHLFDSFKSESDRKNTLLRGVWSGRGKSEPGIQCPQLYFRAALHHPLGSDGYFTSEADTEQGSAVTVCGASRALLRSLQNGMCESP